MPRLKLQRTFHHDFSRTDQNMRVIRENNEFDKILKEYRDVNDLLIKKKNNYCGDELWYGKSSLARAIKRFDENLEELNYNIKKITDTKTFKKAGKNKAYIKQLEKIKLFEDEINNEINRLEEYSKGNENNLKICAKLKDEIKKNNEEYFKKTPYKDFIPLTKVKEKRLLKLYNELVDYYDEFYAKYSKMKTLYNDFTDRDNHNTYILRPLYEEKKILKDKIEKYKIPPKAILAQLEENRIKIWEEEYDFDNFKKEFSKIAGQYPSDFKVELDEKARQFKHIEARTRMMEKILNKEKHLYKEPINKNAEQMANLKKLIEKHENINKDTQKEIIQEKEFIKNIKIPKPIEKPKPNYRDLQEKLKKTIEEQEQIFKDTQKEIIQDKKYIKTFSEEYQKFKNRVDKLIPKKQETIKEAIKDVNELKVNLKLLEELEKIGRTKEIGEYVPAPSVGYLISLLFSEKYKTECPIEPIFSINGKIDIRTQLYNICVCIKKGETVLIVPINLIVKKEGHANMMIIKVETREIYRYEPHGYETTGTDKFNTNADKLWKTLTKELNKCLSLKKTPFKYIPADKTCPRLNKEFRKGLQYYEYLYKRTSGKILAKEGGGYCQLFSFLFAECYIVNKDMPIKLVYEYILDYVNNNAEKAIMIIRGYLHDINDRVNKLINKLDNEELELALKQNIPITHKIFKTISLSPFISYKNTKRDIIEKKPTVFKGNGKY